MLMGINHHRGGVGATADNRKKPPRRKEKIGLRAQVEEFDFKRNRGSYSNMTKRRLRRSEKLHVTVWLWCWEDERVPL